MEPEIGAGLIERINGPFSLRLLLQPAMATLFALRDGRKDAQEGAEPYVQSLFGSQSDRRATLASAWGTLGKILCIAALLDSAFQYTTTGTVSVLQTLLMAFLLCAVPYTLIRGPAARLFGKQ